MALLFRAGWGYHDGHQSDMPLFDRYMMVDWSAANSPRTGANSIWIADSGEASSGYAFRIDNIPTRHKAIETITSACYTAIDQNERIFIGCDFSFGYPAGTAEAITGRGRWDALWTEIARGITDRADNRSNRFAYAAALNRRLSEKLDIEGPFWGHPPGQSHAGLSPYKPAYSTLRERRDVEETIPRAQPNWKLAYPGSVGSQALLGIAQLQRLRCHPALCEHIAIWPFETGFDTDLSKPIIMAETYPALFSVSQKNEEVLDAAQTRCVVEALMLRDKNNTLKALFRGPARIAATQYQKLITEEGWILGAACGL